MIKRIIDISQHSFLSTRLNQLHIEQQNQLIAKVPIEDIGILLLSNPRTSMTQALVTKCMEFNVAVVYCDQKHMPIGLALPLLNAHSLHTKVIQEQIKAKSVVKKQIWQSIVKEKISNQASTLSALKLPSKGLLKMVGRVQSYDKQNHEAQAAKIYWKILFNGEFKRDADSDDINSMLNYGYAIIRATIARAIVCSGLHPALGVFHKNQYNAFCLADDLMEIARPWVDYLVVKYYLEHQDYDINTQFKTHILKCLDKQITFNKIKSPLFVALQHYVNSVKDNLLNSDTTITYPKILELSCLLED